MTFQTDNKKYQLIIRKANITLEWLLRDGFVINSIHTKYSKLAGESIVIDYCNEKTGVKFYLSFRGSFGDYYDMFSASIENKDGKNFMLLDYLTKHKLESEKNSFLLKDDNLEFEVFVEKFFAVLNKLLTTKLQQIIAGKVWEDVPFDWRGIK